MTTGPTKYFILTYHLDTQEVRVEDFGAEVLAAAATYSEREHEHQDDASVEVVMVGGDSLETVRKTHSHYFADQKPDATVADFERQLVSWLDRNAA